jgi:hypothetical protein
MKELNRFVKSIVELSTFNDITKHKLRVQRRRLAQQALRNNLKAGTRYWPTIILK